MVTDYDKLYTKREYERYRLRAIRRGKTPVPSTYKEYQMKQRFVSEEKVRMARVQKMEALAERYGLKRFLMVR